MEKVIVPVGSQRTHFEISYRVVHGGNRLPHCCRHPAGEEIRAPVRHFPFWIVHELVHLIQRVQITLLRNHGCRSLEHLFQCRRCTLPFADFFQLLDRVCDNRQTRRQRFNAFVTVPCVADPDGICRQILSFEQGFAASRSGGTARQNRQIVIVVAAEPFQHQECAPRENLFCRMLNVPVVNRPLPPQDIQRFTRKVQGSKRTFPQSLP